MQDSKSSPKMSKREFLTLAGAAAAVSMSPSLMASSEHAHHLNAYPKDLVGTAEECISTGQACKMHIYQLIKSKDYTLSNCLIVVRDAITACETLVELITNESPHARAMAKVCMDICKDCAEECNRHAAKHKICKEMAESCDATIKACEKYIG